MICHEREHCAKRDFPRYQRSISRTRRRYTTGVVQLMCLGLLVIKISIRTGFRKLYSV